MSQQTVDRFPCGLMTSELDTRKITFINRHLCQILDRSVESLVEDSIDNLFSKASVIFIESYIYPYVHSRGFHNEAQLTIISATGERLPVVANIEWQEANTLHWAIFSAVERDKLYQELIGARDQLEKQAEALTVLASTDPLTGLLNRRAAEAQFKSLVQQSMREPIPLALLLIDIDHFKNINDRYGHEEGDRILVELAEVFSETTRSVDLVARWGGEEFLILLYGTPLDEAEHFCDRLHKQIGKVQLEKVPVRVSIGVVALDLNVGDDSSVLDCAIRRADQALYRAKDAGRNRTIIFQGR